MSCLFNYFFPKQIQLELSVISYNKEEISPPEIRTIVNHIQALMRGSLEQKGNDFLLNSEDNTRILDFTKGLVYFLDALYFLGEDFFVLSQSRAPMQISADSPRESPICVVRFFSNAIQNHNPFATFGNEFFKNNQFGVYFETIDKGAIIFIQDRKSFDLCERCVCPEFINTIISSQALANSSPRDYLLKILRILNISPESAPFTKLLGTGINSRGIPFGKIFRQIER